MTGAETLALFLSEAGRVRGKKIQSGLHSLFVPEKQVRSRRSLTGGDQRGRHRKLLKNKKTKKKKKKKKKKTCEHQAPRAKQSSSCFGSWNCSSVLGWGWVLEKSPGEF